MNRTEVGILIVAVVGVLAIGCKHTKNAESFVDHLEAQQAILDDITLRGWNAQCRVGDYSGYVVRWYDSDYRQRYINYHVLKDGRTGYDYLIDTAMACSLFNIREDQVGSYIIGICKKLSVLSAGFNIDDITFSPNGYCIFNSQYNGWCVAYEAKYLDTIYPKRNDYWNLRHHGFSRFRGHSFWYKKISN